MRCSRRVLCQYGVCVLVLMFLVKTVYFLVWYAAQSVKSMIMARALLIFFIFTADMPFFLLHALMQAPCP